ncbi:MAG TPA: polyketide synthase dehydratase domain-containing protein, partial [Candidatus Portnoybacteria bacterium]|nr:polyketide synthase dehydratase domain-containing protein [Candidatus Portnoybacteria bacterium]
QAEKRFGSINGVVHAAGVADYAGFIQRRTKKQTEEVMKAKVQGTVILDRLLKNSDLDFFVLCSSLSSIQAPAGEVGYVAANLFLDYFAQSQKHIISINWPAWGEIGMFAEAIKNREAKNQIAIDLSQYHPKKIKHHLFDQYINDPKNNQEIYISYFNSKKNWFLSDHKIMGRPTIAGTNYLEMARAAIAKYAKNKDIQIENVYFSVALDVAEGQEKQVVTIIKKDKSHNAYQFSVVSRLTQNYYQEHAQGRIVILDKTKAIKYNIEQLKKECGMEEIVINQDNKNTRDKKEKTTIQDPVAFGPRWQALRWVKYNQKKALGCIELPKQFIKDLNNYQLHPAMLDIAVAILGRRIKQLNDFYFPLSYKSLTIKSPLPQKIYSYVKLSSTSQSLNNQDNSSFDIILMDESGQELVNIKKFTARKAKEGAPRFASDIKLSEQIKLTSPVDNFNLKIGVKAELNSLKFVSSLRQQPQPDEVEIEVQAIALNFRDILLATDMVQPLANTALALGLECSGKIIKIGKNIKNYKIGDEVMALMANCFSPFIVVPASLICKKPSNLNLEEAASVSFAFITAYHMLVKLGKLKRGEKILIHSAAGGVGLAAIQIAQWLGAEVFVTAGSEEKRTFLRYLGIKHVFDSRTLGFAKEIMKITKNQGVDAVLNSLTGEAKIKSIEILTPSGRFLEIGIRDIEKDGRSKSKKIKIIYSPLLEFFARVKKDDNVESTKNEVLNYFKQGIFKPLPYKVFPVTDVINAFRYMSQAKHIGKVVISFKDKKEIFNNLISQQDNATTNTPRSILPREAVNVLARTLANNSPQLIISPIEFSNQSKQPKNIITSDSVIDQQFASTAVIYPRPELPIPYVPANTEREKQLVSIWQEVLGIKDVGINDNFFEIGGNSLNIVHLANKIKRILNINVSVADLFENSTIKLFLKNIKSKNNKHNISDESDKLINETLKYWQNK